MQKSNFIKSAPQQGSKSRGFTTHNTTAVKSVKPTSAPLLVPRPRSSLTTEKSVEPLTQVERNSTQVKSPVVSRPAGSSFASYATPFPIRKTRSHNPYAPVVSPSLEKVLPAAFYNELAPSHHRIQAHVSQQEMQTMDKLLHGGSFVTFHNWQSIHDNQVYEENILGLQSPLQSMQALDVALNGSSPTDEGTSLAYINPTAYGCHLGQFLQDRVKENFLTLRLLADLSGVSLYKCDFDSNNCCRVFVDGSQSYERLVYWNKRLRVTSYGVLVAHTEAAAADLEVVHLGTRQNPMPYHTVPIAAMRTSHETGVPSRYKKHIPSRGASHKTLTPSALRQVEEQQVVQCPTSRRSISTASSAQPEQLALRGECRTPSPVPSSAYASDCEPTPVKNVIRA